MNKVETRQRRARKTRAKIKELGCNRLSVHRSLQHISAQIIDPAGKVLAAATSKDKAIKAKLKYGGNVAAAQVIGKAIAEKAKKIGVTKVAFDRSGFKYHGRIKALADAAREGGIEF